MTSNRKFREPDPGTPTKTTDPAETRDVFVERLTAVWGDGQPSEAERLRFDRALGERIQSHPVRPLGLGWRWTIAGVATAAVMIGLAWMGSPPNSIAPSEPTPIATQTSREQPWLAMLAEAQREYTGARSFDQSLESETQDSASYGGETLTLNTFPGDVGAVAAWLALSDEGADALGFSSQGDSP